MKAAQEEQKEAFKADTARAKSLKELLAVAEKHKKSKAWAFALFKNSAWRQALAKKPPEL